MDVRYVILCHYQAISSPTEQFGSACSSRALPVYISAALLGVATAGLLAAIARCKIPFAGNAISNLP